MRKIGISVKCSKSMVFFNDSKWTIIIYSKTVTKTIT